MPAGIKLVTHGQTRHLSNVVKKKTSPASAIYGDPIASVYLDYGENNDIKILAFLSLGNFMFNS